MFILCGLKNSPKNVLWKFEKCKPMKIEIVKGKKRSGVNCAIALYLSISKKKVCIL